ncbi:MAG: hypothetical protein ACTSUT_19350 [Promethearchaeota archaeon]
MIYLAFQLIFFAISYFSAFLARIIDMRFLIMGNFFRCLAMLMCTFFIKTTFYREKKSHFKIFLLYGIFILFITSFIAFLHFITHDLNLLWLANILFGSLMASVSIWQSYASFSTRKKIKKLNIETYIKKRYILFRNAAILFSILGIVIMFQNPVGTGELYSLIIPFLILILLFTFILLNFLIWIMPKGLKKYFNRGYTTQPLKIEGLSEEIIMQKLLEEE